MKKVLTLLTALLLILSILFSGSVSLAEESEKAPTVIMCYGDSNTYGYDPDPDNARYPKEVRWTTILGKLLGEEYEIIPEGLNGRTTAYDQIGAPWKNGLAHFTPILGTNKPVDMIIFMLGTNDVRNDLALTPEQIADGLEQLILMAKEQGEALQGFVPEIIIIPPVPIYPETEGTVNGPVFDDSSVQKSNELAPLYRQVAERQDCLFLEGTENLQCSTVDCIHLTVESHQALAEMLAELIQSRAE